MVVSTNISFSSLTYSMNMTIDAMLNNFCIRSGTWPIDMYLNIDNSDLLSVWELVHVIVTSIFFKEFFCPEFGDVVDFPLSYENDEIDLF